MSALSNSFFLFFAHTSPFTPESGLVRFLLTLCIDDHGSFVICRADSVRPKHLSDQNFDHDYYFKLPLQGAGCPIQYNRTASFLAMATLAILFSRRIIRCRYLRRQSGLHRAAACAASTSKKRNNVLPCLLICPSRCRPALESSHGISPV